MIGDIIAFTILLAGILGFLLGKKFGAWRVLVRQRKDAHADAEKKFEQGKEKYLK